MWDLIVSIPDHCLSFYFDNNAIDSALFQIRIIKTDEMQRMRSCHNKYKRMM